MRQGIRPIRGALIVAACFAVPVCGPAAAHALSVGVSVPGTGVSVQAQVDPPSGPIPDPPALPEPVGGVAGDAVGTGNDTINTVIPPRGDGGNSSPPPSSGSSGDQPSGGGASPGGNSGSNGGGSGATPRTNGGGRNGGATGRRPSGSARPGRGRRGSGPGGARRGGSPRGGGAKPAANGGTAKKTSKAKKKKDATTSPVARVINRIEQVIPRPVWALIALLALLAAGFALRSRLVSRHATRLERQREELLGDVGLLQRALLPDVPGELRGIEASVAYRPAEGPAAGGDFYDVFDLGDERTAIIVGDVCGHGRQALAVTALMRYTLRAYLGAGFEPRMALKVAGRTIEGDPDSELTTVVLAIYDGRSGTLTYAAAGHEPPILLGPGAHDPVTAYSSPPLGGFMTTGHRQTTVPLPPGSAACFFTDGLVEARLGEQMMGRGRLTELVTELAPSEGAQLLLERLAAAADRAPDDMAACLVRTSPDAVDSRATRIEELEADAADLAGERVLEFLTACGIPERKAQETLRAARAKASEFGGAVLRVHTSGDSGRVEILPSEVAALPVPTLAADARRRAALELSA